MRLTVAVVFVQRHHPFHQQPHPGQLRHRVPVLGVGLDVAGPGAAQGKQHRHVVLAGLVEQRLERRHLDVAQVAIVGVVGAGAAQSVRQRLFVQARGARFVVHEHAGVGAVQVGAGHQQAAALRPVDDQPVHHQQIGGQARLHGGQIVVLHHRAAQAVVQARHPAAGQKQCQHWPHQVFGYSHVGTITTPSLESCRRLRLLSRAGPAPTRLCNSGRGGRVRCPRPAPRR